MDAKERAELVDAVFRAVEGYVDRRLAKAVGPLETRVAALDAPRESHERRLSRHADHLAGLESRLQKLEKGGR